MKGDMSKVLTFEAILRGIEDMLECWISLSSCRGRFSVQAGLLLLDLDSS